MVRFMTNAEIKADPAGSVFSGRALACRRGGRTVFTGLSFDLVGGGALVLRGPNGSGKTTLLRLMAGLARPIQGSLTWAGQVIDDGHGRRVRFVGHQDAIKPAMSLHENLAFWSDLVGGRATDIDRALKVFDLSRLSHLPARLLSAGQRHRLALARILLGDAKIWLLDEPANTLDEPSLCALKDAIAAHRTGGGMVVIASHGDGLAGEATTLSVSDFRPTARNAEAA